MTEQEPATDERDTPMPPAGVLPGLRIPPTRLPTLDLTRAERTCLAICLGALLLGAVIWAAAATSSDPRPDPQPVVVRTVDGVATTPVPEDLDR